MFDSSHILRESKTPIFDGEEKDFYCGKTVLVSGGGGSVGSVLVRKLSDLPVKSIIIFDIYENNAYELQLELCAESTSPEISVEIGSVSDRQRVETLFEKYKPDIVFHAAAHKHVSLMENNCAQALRNNCIGTYICANAAEKYGCERFVLVSTDKAVRPTGVMGASKRVCEMLVLPRRSETTSFCAVRFGNVFGSHGSVIPLFEKQIERGGPVTVTDKRVTRFFISLSDAADLLLCAGAMAKRGELFVLDMGEPYRIYDIACRMIEISGKSGIEIVETGLRPGEKLYEEYLIPDKSCCEKTANDRIFIEKSENSNRFSPSTIADILYGVLANKNCYSDNTLIKSVLEEIVPDYSPDV